MIRAKELALSDRISFSSKLGLFFVMDNNSCHTVKMSPIPACTCPVKKSCLHVMAVKLGMGMSIDEDLDEKRNFAVMRKNVRPVKQKAGRKRPRHGDVSPVRQKHVPSFTDVPCSPVPSFTDVPCSPVPSDIPATAVPSRHDDFGVPFKDDVPCINVPSRDDVPSFQKIPRSDVPFFPNISSPISSTQKHSGSVQHRFPQELSPVQSGIEIPSDQDTSYAKDIRYSLEVWVPADGEKPSINLNVDDRKILTSKAWLNDTIIDASMSLLSRQFPELDWFQSCLCGRNRSFKRHSNLFIQIINRDPIG